MEAAGVRGQYFDVEDPQTMAFFGQDEEMGNWLFFRGQYFLQANPIWLSTVQLTFLGCLFLMGTGVLLFVFSIWSHLANKVRFFAARWLNAMPLLCLGGMVYAGTRLELEYMGKGNLWEWMVFLLGLAMVGFTLAGGWQTLKAWRTSNAKLVRFVLTFTALANGVITSYLALEGMIGLRLWVY